MSTIDILEGKYKKSMLMAHKDATPKIVLAKVTTGKLWWKKRTVAYAVIIPSESTSRCSYTCDETTWYYYVYVTHFDTHIEAKKFIEDMK